MILTGKARLAGVIGWPVGHSRSPSLHGFWLERHGIDGAYLPLAVRPADFAAVLDALPKMGFAGANVTVPHKEEAYRLVACRDPSAERLKAVNTLVRLPDGRLEGRNSDAFGFRASLQAGAPFFSAALGPAVVLGAGGAARAVVAALQDEGVAEIRLVNRSLGKARALAEDLFRPGCAITVLDWSARQTALDGAALLVNGTTLGMSGQPPLDLDLNPLPRDALVTDIVYAPRVTPLLAAAAARGNPTVDGLGMLLHQARPGFAAWFGVWPEVDAELCAFLESQA